MPESVDSSSITIFHGTGHFFEEIDLERASRVDGRHGRDQYGTGFYTAFSQDGETGANYATSYVESDGLVLQARVSLSQISLLEAEAVIVEPELSNIVTGIRRMAASPETPDAVKLYLNHVADQIRPSMQGADIWDLISNNSSFARFMQQQSAALLPDMDTLEDTLSHDKTILFRDGISVLDLSDLNEAEQLEFRGRVEGLANSDGVLRPYYQSLLDNPNKLFDPNSYGFDGPRFALDEVRKANSQQSFQSGDIHMDRYATTILNESGLHGIRISSEDTIVWKGSGVRVLPDFAVLRIIGDGPQGAPADLAEGDVVIRGSGQVFVDGSPHEITQLEPEDGRLQTTTNDSPNQGGSSSGGAKAFGVLGAAFIAVNALGAGDTAEAAEAVVSGVIDMTPAGGVTNEVVLGEQRTAEMFVAGAEDLIQLAGGALAPWTFGISIVAGVVVADAFRLGASLAGYDVDPSMIQVASDYASEKPPFPTIVNNTLNHAISNVYELRHTLPPNMRDIRKQATDIRDMTDPVAKAQAVSEMLWEARVETTGRLQAFMEAHFEELAAQVPGVETPEQMIAILMDPLEFNKHFRNAHAETRTFLDREFGPIRHSFYVLDNAHAYLVQEAAANGIEVAVGPEKEQTPKASGELIAKTNYTSVPRI